MEFGYVRVSAKDQNDARQMAALQEAGIPPRNIYREKKSGKDFDRPAYKRLLRRLHPGDVVYILSIAIPHILLTVYTLTLGSFKYQIAQSIIGAFGSAFEIREAAGSCSSLRLPGHLSTKVLERLEHQQCASYHICSII